MTFTRADAGRAAARSICPFVRKETPTAMTTAAHSYPFVIGVDTHARTHSYAVLAANGGHLDTETFPNTHAGRARAIAWAARRTGCDLGALWVIDGTGSYAALLAGTVARAGYRVIEAPRVRAHVPARRGTGKSDPLDAGAIAAAALPLEESHLVFRVRTRVPPWSAAWSHLGRVRSGAAFPALAGVNPIPASSGNTAGTGSIGEATDASTAPCTWPLSSEWSTIPQPAPMPSAGRQKAEGKTPREIRRCLNRYLTRRLYRALNALHTDDSTRANAV